LDPPNQNSTKTGVTKLDFELLTFKLKVRVFLEGDTVAMVTYFITKMILNCSAMTGQSLNTMIVASTDKKRLQ